MGKIDKASSYRITYHLHSFQARSFVSESKYYFTNKKNYILKLWIKKNEKPKLGICVLQNALFWRNL
jgi:hypothetical protein